jgi:hypothetical protein
VIEVRKLLASDDRTTLRSGNPDLDRFFQKYAAQNQFKLYVGTTYVAVDTGEMLGFVTLAASAIEVDNLPLAVGRRLPAIRSRCCGSRGWRWTWLHKVAASAARSSVSLSGLRCPYATILAAWG